LLWGLVLLLLLLLLLLLRRLGSNRFSTFDACG
jgi:hypothetical protein